MSDQTLQQFVIESFAKMDSQVHEMLSNGDSTEAVLAASLGHLQGVLAHIAKRVDEIVT